MDRTLISLVVAAVGISLAWAGFTNTDPREVVARSIFGKSGSVPPLVTPTEAPEAGGGIGAANIANNAVGNLTGNRAIGQPIAARFGWGSGRQWNALDTLWTRESGWNHRAINPTSGAAGIPQVLPSAHPGVVTPQWMRDPAAQIRWGLNYIRGRYGTPVAALAHSNAVGWY